jgi:indole-3-acetate monooxygenase
MGGIERVEIATALAPREENIVAAAPDGDDSGGRQRMIEGAMQLRTDATLIEAARRIAPVIREHNQEAERERRLSPPVLAALHEAGLLRMCTPRSLGGLEADPLTRALVIEEISGHDSAAGWTLANPLDWAYLCARLPDQGAEEIYGRGANVVTTLR